MINVVFKLLGLIHVKISVDKNGYKRIMWDVNWVK